MLKQLFICLLALSGNFVQAQFKYDNVLYRNVDPDTLCATLKAHKGYLLLDVRTKGEFEDTSSAASYNIGHLKGSVNINVRELGSRLHEISDYKNKPVFIYCSHSQRSRRASKMLTDSGFTRVFNVNGGLSSFYFTTWKNRNCLKELVETKNKYGFLSAEEVCKLASAKRPRYFILDVRPDSAFRHISRDAKENAYGAILNSVNIPLAELDKRIGDIPRGIKIVITDIYGEDAATAAVKLVDNGYTNVFVLAEGIDRLIQTDPNELTCLKNYYRSPVTYSILSTKEFGSYYRTNPDALLLDIRTREEFANAHKDYWRNTGHLKNALNIPAAELEKTVEGLGTSRNRPIVIYTYGNGSELYAVADGLQKEGFTNISVLAGGIFYLRWTAGNVKGQEWLKELVLDIPENNQ
jgi:rhodanese-related sulfurtransferase